MGNVFQDDAPGVPAAERFKLLYSAVDESGNFGGVFLAASADGLFFKALNDWFHTRNRHIKK
jgi:hypothetical protein